ncbi:LysR family transcriptional regulator [Burkholderia stabilis]|uniref:LysR family transcriptional regulator n=2 Tax=Burkholderia stabilis TaxID=95485 RepID=A0A4Q2A583_9BURK|nr:LysR family transcriptional regulator [Burkholderia stabilis]
MLRTFLAVERFGNMAAAADRMALTHTAVGAQMRTLERVCQRQLFDRSGRSVQLNDAGRSILDQARSVVAAYDSLIRGVSVQQSIEGAVTIGGGRSVIGFLATNAMRLKVQYPGLKISLVSDNDLDLPNLVRTGKIDAAMVVGEPRATTLPESWEYLYDEPLVLLAHPSIAPADTSVSSLLRRIPYIRFDPTSLTGQHVTSLVRRLRVQVDPVLQIDSVLPIADLVRQNVGISIVPHLRHAGWNDDPQLFVKSVPGSTWRRTIGWYDSGRQPLASAIVKNRLLAALTE